MLSKNIFCKLIRALDKQSNAEEYLEKALERYFQDEDFTGIHDARFINTLIEILETEMRDTDGYITWWLWDCPNAGKGKRSHCTITFENGDKFVIRTPEDLYDFLQMNYGIAPDDETYEALFSQQKEGAKFALYTLQNMRKTNEETGNEGWEERNALLKLAEDKIANEYMLATGSDDPTPEEPLRMRLLHKKEQKDDESDRTE